MSSEQPGHGGFHLPEPSAVPIVTCIGIALILAGLVPDSRLWRFAIVSIGAIIAITGATLWIRDARAEFRNLPD